MTHSQSVPTDLVGEAERVFAAAAAACVTSLEQLAVGPAPLPYLDEAHHLAPKFRPALAHAATDARPTPEVSPTLSAAKLNPLWPRLGPFDVSLRWGSKTVYGELKCGPDEDALEACAWDALKCVFALRHGFGSGMLLLAGAPKTLWDGRARGCELFNDGHWDAADLRARYVRSFTRWERDGYKPLHVPDRLRTLRGPRVSLDINGDTWLLALARIEPVGEGWLTWEPFLPVEGLGTDRSDREFVDELIDPTIEVQNTREINEASFRRFREGLRGSAEARPSECSRLRQHKSRSTRAAGGVEHTPFEIFYDEHLPLEEKERQLTEITNRPRHDEELQDAKDYLGKHRSHEGVQERTRRGEDRRLLEVAAGRFGGLRCAQRRRDTSRAALDAGMLLAMPGARVPERLAAVAMAWLGSTIGTGAERKRGDGRWSAGPG